MIHISGSGYNTNPQDTLWFCHLCHASFVLPLGSHHTCSPQKP